VLAAGCGSRPDAAAAFLAHKQVQTIKTAIEAACLLLRIDDIVSGIAKKARGADGPSMQQGPQTEDADGVRSLLVCCMRMVETVNCIASLRRREADGLAMQQGTQTEDADGVRFWGQIKLKTSRLGLLDNNHKS